MKFLIAIIPFFCLLQSSKAQLQDTSKLVFKTKILLLEYAEVFDQEGIDYFFKEMPLEFQPLRSKGFSKNMMFFRIPIEYDKTSLVSFAFNYDFIIGYNNLNGSIYRLKGFKKNDFYIIFSQFSYSFNVDDTVNIRKNLSAKKKFADSSFKCNRVRFYNSIIVEFNR